MFRLKPWLYVSTSRIDPDDIAFQVNRIVSVSRSRNAERSVTGALIHSGTRFLQYIEGPPAAVPEIKNSILGDERHENIVTVPVRERYERIFEGWSLAYGGESRFIETVIEKALAQELSESGHNGVQAIRLLKKFC